MVTHKNAWLLAGAVTVAILLGVVRQGDSAEIRVRGQTMGTHFEVVVLAPPDGMGHDTLASAANDVLRKINAQMSTYAQGSEISRFNASDSVKWHAISPDFAAVLRAAHTTSTQTDGAFDITVQPLIDLWGFGREKHLKPRRPSVESLHAVRSLVGWSKIDVDRVHPQVRKAEGRMRIDLSAIAKGYAVDAIARMLKQHGATRYLVDIGGEVRVHGAGPNADRWRIAIERPTDGSPGPHVILGLDDGACATSGDYRNYVVIDGQRFSHIIDPRTGEPVRHQLASVSVIHEHAATADALATGLFVLGPIDGLRTAQTLGLAALFIEREGSQMITTMTPAMHPYVETRP
ncbi:MAG: thiamine biosynthesis lipoprotein [Gammaproteobacteria bacterium]|jgi:thiamine biosynthesis lipoprotein